MKGLIGLLAFAVVCSFCGCGLIAAGSYPYAETYEYKIAEDSLIGILESLKANDSSLVVPELYRPSDGRRGSSGYWYFIYFYNKERDETIVTWTRTSIDTAYTTFAFVAVKKREDVSNWKEINHDFGRKENRARKKEFKALILDRIHLPIKED
ncbi:MAG TPA: hypothetical protein VGE79_05060 [Niastella sp.]